MPIQFLCPSCQNPIEIDDEFASQRVACPYCRNTIGAPQSSTYVPPTTLHAARPLESPWAGAPPIALSPIDPARPNGVAVVSLVLSLAWLAAWLYLEFFVGPKIIEAVGENATPQEAQRYFLQQVQSGNTPDWLMPATALFLLMALFWVGGLVCAIIGLRTRRRRGFAIATLCVLALGPVLVCFNVVTSSGLSG